MATRRKAAAPAAAPVDVPQVLVSGESNKYVGRAMAALAKKWNLTRAETVADALHVAWFLVALGRPDDARELAEHVAERVGFNNDANLWLQASSAIALAARLARLSGDDSLRASLVALLVEHPIVPATPRESLLKAIAEADKDLRSAEVDTSQKWACQGFARGCARATYFRETAAESCYEGAAIDVAALDRTIAEGLDGLRAHLAR